ncbi:DUF1217 domain-containing protein [Thioclava sp. BHET1]|nr:DUF1217 domain-containing protein [Thioclava sp. BHET1]
MSYQPIIPFSGYAGWSFLNRTMEKQQAAFNASSEIQRNEDYFREKIGSVETAEDLVNDRRLLSVALGAFGLDEDINNKFFIRKVLEEGSLDSESLANKLSDKRYLKLTQAFGFGDYGIPRTVLSDFPDEIVQKYERRQFEVAVGETDNSLRIALSVQRDLPELAAKDSSEKTKWYTIIGSPAMSEMMQTALGLPKSIGALDVDAQVRIYAEKADRLYGSTDPAQFAEPDTLKQLTRDYFLRSQLTTGTTITAGNAALSLLQGAQQNRLSLLL